MGQQHQSPQCVKPYAYQRLRRESVQMDVPSTKEMESVVVNVQVPAKQLQREVNVFLSVKSTKETFLVAIQKQHQNHQCVKPYAYQRQREESAPVNVQSTKEMESAVVNVLVHAKLLLREENAFQSVKLIGEIFHVATQHQHQNHLYVKLYAYQRPRKESAQVNVPSIKEMESVVVNALVHAKQLLREENVLQSVKYIKETFLVAIQSSHPNHQRVKLDAYQKQRKENAQVNVLSTKEMENLVVNVQVPAKQLLRGVNASQNVKHTKETLPAVTQHLHQSHQSVKLFVYQKPKKENAQANVLNIRETASVAVNVLVHAKQLQREVNAFQSAKSLKVIYLAVIQYSFQIQQCPPLIVHQSASEQL